MAYTLIYLLGWRETCYTRWGQLLFRGGQLYCLVFFTKVNKFSVTLEVSDGRYNLSFQIVLLNLLLLIFNQFRLNIGNLIFLKILYWRSEGEITEKYSKDINLVVVKDVKY